MKLSLKILTWNIGFGSSKDQLKGDDLQRLSRMFNVYIQINPDIIAFQEIANRSYLNGTQFQFIQQLKEKDPFLTKTHFEKALSLGGRNAYPYGKYVELNQELGINMQETGVGIFFRNQNEWSLCNLFSDSPQAPPIVETQRALPHALYMGKDAETSAGRDEEDRPILWARITHSNLPKHLKVYVVSLHFPTLKGEEENLPTGNFNPTQTHIFQNILQLPPDEMDQYTVDDLGAALRVYILKQLDFQAQQLENFWLSDNPENRCLFLFAGDFNFCHQTAFFPQKTKEYIFLENQGYQPLKKEESSRSGKARLHDNIWIKNPIADSISSYSSSFIHELPLETLDSISDHYPIVGNIEFDF